MSDPSSAQTVEAGAAVVVDGSNGQYGAVLGADVNNPWVGSYTNHDLRVVTGNVEKMRIALNGNVGIGTSSPERKLHVVGNEIRLQNGSKVIAMFTTGKAVDLFSPSNSLFIQSSGTGPCPWECNNVIINPSGQNGKVGIGTDSPQAKLHIRGSGTDSDTSTALWVANANGAPALIATDGGKVAIGSLSPQAFTSHVCLTPPFTNYGNAMFFAPCGSAAEYVPTVDNGFGYPEVGDLVSMLPTTQNPYNDAHAPFVVSKATSANDSNLIGFILEPELGADGKKLNDHYMPLGIYGYFPVKITMENGPIQRGDPITSSSKPGYGMKATKPGRIVGYALEDATKEGMIQTIIRPGDYLGDAVTRIEMLEKQVSALQIEMEMLMTKLGEPK